MRLADLRPGDAVFVDANIFIYHFGGGSLECRAFLERCASRELVGHTATPTLAEVIHRLMLAEAVQAGIVAARTAVRRLKERPDLVMQLTHYNEEMGEILQMNLTILSLTPEVLSLSAAERTNHGLLTNDSLVVSLMRANGLTRLATADSDFERIPDLEVYTPGDLG
jgi:predicted nucleic acid-binding protein